MHAVAFIVVYKTTADDPIIELRSLKALIASQEGYEVLALLFEHRAPAQTWRKILPWPNNQTLASLEGRQEIYESVSLLI